MLVLRKNYCNFICIFLVIPQEWFRKKMGDTYECVSEWFGGPPKKMEAIFLEAQLAIQQPQQVGGCSQLLLIYPNDA